MYRNADFYEVKGEIVTCNICPHNCVLKPGQLSRCFSRKNINGDMVIQNYQRVLAIATEPIEKKTLLHYL
jgi:pyruvate formate lyase activating enzyme